MHSRSENEISNWRIAVSMRRGLEMRLLQVSIEEGRCLNLSGT